MLYRISHKVLDIELESVALQVLESFHVTCCRATELSAAVGLDGVLFGHRKQSALHDLSVLFIDHLSLLPLKLLPL